MAGIGLPGWTTSPTSRAIKQLPKKTNVMTHLLVTPCSVADYLREARGFACPPRGRFAYSEQEGDALRLQYLSAQQEKSFSDMSLWETSWTVRTVRRTRLVDSGHGFDRYDESATLPTSRPPASRRSIHDPCIGAWVEFRWMKGDENARRCVSQRGSLVLVLRHRGRRSTGPALSPNSNNPASEPVRNLREPTSLGPNTGQGHQPLVRTSGTTGSTAVADLFLQILVPGLRLDKMQDEEQSRVTEHATFGTVASTCNAGIRRCVKVNAVGAPR